MRWIVLCAVVVLVAGCAHTHPIYYCEEFTYAWMCEDVRGGPMIMIDGCGSWNPGGLGR